MTWRRWLARKLDPAIDEELKEAEHNVAEARAYAASRIDVKEIMRQLIGGYSPVFLQGDHYSALSEHEKEEYELWGYAVHHSRWWLSLTEWMLNRMGKETLQNVILNEKSGWFGAGQFNALMALREEVERASVLREARLAPKGTYDKHKIIP
jgi:hypothetical protein